MISLNRILILLLLIALLYALYKYQQQIIDKEEAEYKKKRKIKSINNKVIEKDDISIDNISQFSLGSLEDIKSNLYKQDSILDSLDSNSLGSLGSMAETYSFLDSQE